MTSRRPETLSLAQARRVALAAQGFRDLPGRTPTRAALAATVARTGVLQVDSVNVLARAHYLPVFSRLGSYPLDLLHEAASGRRRRLLIEYYSHAQALNPVDLWPVLQYRMARYRAMGGKWSTQGVTPEVIGSVLAQLEARGASTARDLDGGSQRSTEHWGWNWSVARRALDALAVMGEVAVAGRNAQFEIRYDLPERVLPDEVLTRPALEEPDALRELVRRAARSHGVASVDCLADYYRLSIGETKVAVAELVDAGELCPVRVPGWDRPLYLDATARVPRSLEAVALLAPFDPVVWHRRRAADLFDFDYRIEIYTRAENRRYGYYVLPFLCGAGFAARVDLKADRQAGVLRVRAAHYEPGAETDEATTAEALARSLRSMQQWLGLGDLVAEERGDLAAQLRRVLGSSTPD